ncbi:unnamed protein product, partial [Mesorhabditis spiculigera]
MGNQLNKYCASKAKNLVLANRRLNPNDGPLDNETDAEENLRYDLNTQERWRQMDRLNAFNVVNLQRRLVNDLLDPDYYEKTVHPRRDHLYNTRINVSMSLYQILDVDEHSQSIIVNVWMVQKCETLEQKKTESLSHASIETGYWRNDSRGAFIQLMFPAIYRLTCKMDVRLFPYDVQNCTFIISSWTRDNRTIDYWPEVEEINLGSLTRNEEWDVISFKFQRFVKTYACCPDSYVMLHAHLVIRRKPLYYIVNLVIPTSIITLVAVTGFFTPTSSSSERDEKLYLGWYYMGIIFVIVIGTLMATIVLAIHGQKHYLRPLSRKIRRLVHNRVVSALILEPPTSLIELWTEFGIVDAERLPMADMDPLLVEKLDPISELPGRAHALFQSISSEVSDVPGLEYERRMASITRQYTVHMRQKERERSIFRASAANARQIKKQKMMRRCALEWEYLANVLDRLLLTFFCSLTTVFFVLLVCLAENSSWPENDEDTSGEENVVKRPKWNGRAGDNHYFKGFKSGRNRLSGEKIRQPYQPPSNAYGNAGSSYGLPPSPYKPEKFTKGRVSKDASSSTRAAVTGAPDTSDPCFRKYGNAIIVNAQPYERRSSTAISICKKHCLESQLGVYNCRSFVFDNVNKICDLFAHVGDQAPARLQKFQTRDYYEPTGAVECDVPIPTESISTTLPDDVSSATDDFGGSESTTGNELDGFKDDPSSSPTSFSSTSTYGGYSSSYGPVPAQTTPEEITISTEPTASETTFFSEEDYTTTDAASTPPSTPIERSITKESCPAGKATRFLRTGGFELFKNDDITIAVNDVEECVEACTNNEVNSQPMDCKSFDFSDGQCALTVEAAVPLGGGQLKQKSNSEYYEKICIDGELAENCPKVFARFPQMILVGFAESVNDATTFEDCFHNCLNSFALYGFNCSSGMYYFEENQLNCILNSEDRHSQADLFAEENTDIVDYFEVACKKGVSRKAKAFGANTLKIDPINSGLVTAEETTTEWSVCEDGVQHRRRDCADKTQDCGLESRPCKVPPGSDLDEVEPFTMMDRGGYAKSTDAPDFTTTSTTTQLLSTATAATRKNKMNVDKLKSALKRLTCPMDVCCKVFDSCQIGLMRNRKKRKIEWCRRPC